LSLGAPSPGRRRACVLFGVSFRGGYSPTGLPGATVLLALPPTGWGGLSVLSQILPRGPTNTIRFDDCDSARLELVNAATSIGAVRLLSRKHLNRSICRTARCLARPRLDSTSRGAPFSGSSTVGGGSALSRQVSSRSECFLHPATDAADAPAPAAAVAAVSRVCACGRCTCGGGGGGGGGGAEGPGGGGVKADPGGGRGGKPRGLPPPPAAWTAGLADNMGDDWDVVGADKEDHETAAAGLWA